MKKKMFGAVLCSAALAIGMAMPAFAVTGGSVTAAEKHEGQALQTGSASTAIEMKTENTQIDVAVPLKIAFYAESAGGALGVPSDNAYSIDNYSSANVYITSMNVAYATSNAGGVQWTIGTPSSISGKVAETAVYGDFGLTAKYKEGKTTLALTDKTKTLEIGEMWGASDGEKHFIDKATDAGSPGKYIINWEGASSILNKVDTNATEAIKITYTISTNPLNATSGGAITQTN